MRNCHGRPADWINPTTPRSARRSGFANGGGEAPAKRILLVDDDYEIVDSMRLALEAKGFQVLVARDGNQGLAMAEARTRTW